MPTIDPTRIYEVKTTSGGSQVCLLTPACVINAAALNVVVVSAITGKRIRIMGWTAQTDSATTTDIATFSLINGSGGSTIQQALGVPSYGTGNFAEKEIKDSGYGETSTGVGLYINIGLKGLAITVYYIAYIP